MGEFQLSSDPETNELATRGTPFTLYLPQPSTFVLSSIQSEFD